MSVVDKGRNLLVKYCLAGSAVSAWLILPSFLQFRLLCLVRLGLLASELSLLSGSAGGKVCELLLLA